MSTKVQSGIALTAVTLLTLIITLLGAIQDSGQVDVSDIQTAVAVKLTQLGGTAVDGPTAEAGTPAPTEIHSATCVVLVGPSPYEDTYPSGDPVYLLQDVNGKPGTKIMSVLEYGTEQTVYQFYVVRDVSEEWSKVSDGWVRNNGDFPAYNYPSCWNVPVVRANSAVPTPTATFQPTAAATPTPLPVTCEAAPLTTSYINIRSDPGTWASIVGQFTAGSRATVLRKSGDWYQIKLGTVTGWVAGWLIERSAGCAI